MLVTDSTFNQINTCVGDVTGSTMCLPVIAATHFTVSHTHMLNMLADWHSHVQGPSVLSEIIPIVRIAQNLKI